MVHLNKLSFNHNRSFSYVLIFSLSCMVISSCDVNDSAINSGTNSGDWLIPTNEIVDGGPGKDGIPSIDNPDFDSVENTDFIPDDRMVVGVNIEGEIRAYPHQVLDWHEIVNDQAGDKHFAIAYCPLTGTGMTWNRNINGNITEFGVSGLLFRNNLIAYDRNTDSNWSQMQLRSVNGDLLEQEVETYQLLETTWSTWKALFPDSEVHTTNTGHSRNYSAFTYGSTYSTNHSDIRFPRTHTDNRLQNKIRVHGIINGNPDSDDIKVRVYVLNRFGSGVTIIRDSIQNDQYVIAGSTEYNFAAAFHLDSAALQSLEFTPVENELPAVMQDNEGNKWDIFGIAVSGPREGTRLTAAKSYTGYWFAWADFFPGLEIYTD